LLLVEIMAMKIGEDEFCSKCMEWREYDENGRCKVCGKIIVKQKIKEKKDSYSEYEREELELDENDEL